MTLSFRRAAWTIVPGSAVIGLLLALRFFPLERPPAGTLRIERPVMGTLWSMEVDHHGRPEAARQAVEKAFDELRRIDALMSEWKPDSPLSAINAGAGREMAGVPQELREIIERAIRYGEESEGAFDITWRGMGRIWRFDEQFAVPTRAEAAEARALVNYREIQIQGNRVGLPRAGMAIGLGGIAKGYAVDRAGLILSEDGFSDFLVAGAGDILASGKRLGQPWRVGIQDPRGERAALLDHVLLSGRAVSTSGDYERYRLVDGVRYHHIIDPRTGWPAGASISVSVIAGAAEKTDALATAIFVLGAEKGMALARREGVEALLIDANGKRHSTEGFDKYRTTR